MIAYPPERKNPTVPSGTLTLIGALLLMTAFIARAQTSSSVSVAWNPVSAVGLGGYHLYQGTASGSYTNQISVGNKTNATVSGLVTGVKYFFAVTAYTTDGMESPYSNEISYTPSVGPSTSPSSNPLPAIVLIAPLSNSSYVAPAQINIAASVTTNGHTINKVQFFNGAVLLAEDANPPYAFTWSNVGAGAYRLSTQVVFDSTNSISSPTANVTVAAPPTSSLTFASTSGTITAPFIASNGVIYQTSETSLTNSGRAVYPFTITAAGSYVISAMTIAPNNGANSLYVNIDAEPTDPNMIWDVPISTNLAQSAICWRGNTNTNGVPGADQFSPKIFNLTQGTHQLIVRGREANTQLGTITLSPANSPAPSATPPLVVLTSPNNNSTYSAPANLTLAASVTPNGHTISKVQFFNGAALLGESLTPPYSVAWANIGAGNYNLTASAIYDSNSTVSTPVATVSITNPVASSISFAAGAGTISSPFVVSNGLVLQAVETGISGAGRAVYNFNVPSTGDYLVSAMVIAPNNGANSFYVNIDADPTDPVMIWDLALTTTLTSQTVCWRGNVNSNGVPGADQFSPKAFNLAQGSHQLIILGREANTQLGTITISPANVLPAPWQVLDVGNPGITGNASVTNGAYSLSGGGNLSGSSDNFRFLYQPMTGDSDLRARITSLQNTTANACAGVMVRETLTPGSRYAFLGVLPDGTVRSQSRASAAGGASAANFGTLSLPNAWARLVRSNNSVLAYKSSDGASWTLIGSNSIAMATNIYFGLAVASGTNNALSVVTLTNVVAVP